DSVTASYDSERLWESLRVQGAINHSHIMPSDFRSLLPKLKNYQHTIGLDADFTYQDEACGRPDQRS
ncbi:MAG: hypothetical protein II575_00170, partial [Bacteroidales bacterium]|nr:hypothetical protein [Bacteroidales bacterium]